MLAFPFLRLLVLVIIPWGILGMFYVGIAAPVISCSMG